MDMMKTKIALVVGSMMAASPAIAVTNMLTNGSFENGLSGWTESDVGANPSQIFSYYPADTVTSASPDAAGAQGVYIVSDVGTVAISQTVSLIAGHTYALGFDYEPTASSNPYDFTLTLTLGDQALGSVTSNASQYIWYNAAYTTTANVTGNAAYALTFASQGNPGRDVTIDRAYLIDTTSAVPEPASWAMMIGGFGIVGRALRQRRAAAKLA